MRKPVFAMLLGGVLGVFDGLTALEGEWVQSATLHVPLSGTWPADVDVMIDVPRTSWTSAASWTSPWAKGGGDPHDEQAVVREPPRVLRRVSYVSPTRSACSAWR